VWLLVDGLDELTASAREDLLEWLREWPGPLVATSRHLPRAPSDFAAYEVEDLTRSEVEATRTGLRIATDMWLTILPGSPAQAYGEDRVPGHAVAVACGGRFARLSVYGRGR